MTEYLQSPVVAIDLGSNSFHLLQATLDEAGQLKPLQAMARKVQLALGMENNRIQRAAIKRGLECLREFAPFCHQLPVGSVRVVGTQALRVARNRSDFVELAAQILNHSVEIISGDEEAQLAYLGVAAEHGRDGDLLVADIGGGSTELVTGSQGVTSQVASLPLGCVTWLRFFVEGRISSTAFDQALQAGRQAFDAVAHRFVGDWQATGCSGTLLAVAEVLKQQGWSDGAITSDGLRQLRQALLNFEHIDAVRFQGLMEDRRSIFASGVAIVTAMFESLGLDRMSLSRYGLREGVARSLLS